MSYWKGLMIAVAIDLIWIMGCPLVATEPVDAVRVEELNVISNLCHQAATGADARSPQASPRVRAR